MGKPFAKEDLVGMFSEALGNDKAQQLIEEAIRILGLQQKNSFEREDILAIAKELKRLNTDRKEPWRSSSRRGESRNVPIRLRSADAKC